KEHSKVNVAVLRTIVEVVKPVNGRADRSRRLARARFLMQVGHVVAHPQDCFVHFAFEPDCGPLSRPVMRVPYLVSFLDSARELDHVEISTHEVRPAQPGPEAATKLDDADILANFGKASGGLIGAGVDDNFMSM